MKKLMILGLGFMILLTGCQNRAPAPAAEDVRARVNLITNGDFESGTDGWEYYGQDCYYNADECGLMAKTGLQGCPGCLHGVGGDIINDRGAAPRVLQV